VLIAGREEGGMNMRYFLMLITGVVLWRALKINLIIAASVSVVFWGIVGPIISYILYEVEKRRET
jgi:hypothetical protein